MMRALVLVFQLLVSLLLLRLLWRAIGRLFVPPGAARRPPGSGTAEDLVRDPVCGTFVPRSRAVGALVAGREERFCSVACRDRALLAARTAS
jgi:hypothetical protein